MRLRAQVEREEQLGALGGVPPPQAMQRVQGLQHRVHGPLAVLLTEGPGAEGTVVRDHGRAQLQEQVAVLSGVRSEARPGPERVRGPGAPAVHVPVRYDEREASQVARLRRLGFQDGIVGLLASQLRVRQRVQGRQVGVRTVEVLEMAVEVPEARLLAPVEGLVRDFEPQDAP